jgi:hypothetical protein
MSEAAVVDDAVDIVALCCVGMVVVVVDWAGECGLLLPGPFVDSFVASRVAGFRSLSGVWTGVVGMYKTGAVREVSATGAFLLFDFAVGRIDVENWVKDDGPR